MNYQEFLQEWHNDSPQMLVHTSGSTGLPKPIWVEKRRMLASAKTTCDFLGLREGDTALLCMSLDYIAGKMMAVRSIERHLHLIVVEPSGHPLQRLAQDGADIAFAAMVPMQVYNTLQVAEERERLRSIRHLIIGGGAIDERLARELSDFPNAVWSTYGMTETLSHIALSRINPPGNNDEQQSQATEMWYTPVPGVSVSTNDDGCLVVDAPLVCDGRLQTNDIAEISADGRQFRILGRKDNVICSGGIKIQAEEVERRLRPHLARPFAISKRRDERYGEAVVLLTEDTEPDRLRDICREVLPKYWQPRLFVHTDTIPTTATGKPAREAIARIAEGHPQCTER